MNRLARVLACAFLFGCAAQPGTGSTKAADSDAVSILLFGDTGYDYDWLEEDDYEDAFTGREFVINELDDWIEDYRPIEEFAIPPMHFAEQTGGYVMASGMWPVSKAVHNWCAAKDKCDFGVMLGDNIYPSGATVGADGRDDGERFDDLLWKPYKGLKDQDPQFVIYPVLGNHDWDTSREGAMAQVAYLEQSPLYDLDGIFYRKRAAPDVEVFAIDTTVLLNGLPVYDDALAPDGTPIDTGKFDKDEPWAEPVGKEERMLEWLERSLAESDARWKIVIAHHPIWSSSGTKHEEGKVLREVLLPMLCRYADAYIVGHDHTLELHSDDCRDAGNEYRNLPPLVQVVSGAAGKQRPAHTPFMAWQDRAFPQKKTWYARGLVWGFAELQLEGDTAAVTIVSTPNSGSGEPVVEYSKSFERRSGKSSTVASQ
ncbi:MAG TPA: metallophosphoesterase [Woeseiaceae bacterium]|nr:metallophosphoesterase [Woeseiaceae bacterium]